MSGLIRRILIAHDGGGPSEAALASPSIVACAANNDYDTMVIGSRQLGRIRRRLLGSVSYSVANHSRSTVIIAP